MAGEGWASSRFTLGASGALGWDQGAVPVLWMGWRIFTLTMGSVMPVSWGTNGLHPPNSRCFKVLPGAFTLLCLYTEFFAESAVLMPDCTRCQAFCFPQGVHFSRRPHMGPRYHLPESGSRPWPSPLHGGRCAVLSARCLPRQSRSSPSPPRRGERGEEIAADGAASAAGLGMTKFGSATCRLFFLLWRI